MLSPKAGVGALPIFSRASFCFFICERESLQGMNSACAGVGDGLRRELDWGRETWTEQRRSRDAKRLQVTHTQTSWVREVPESPAWKQGLLTLPRPICLLPWISLNIDHHGPGLCAVIKVKESAFHSLNGPSCKLSVFTGNYWSCRQNRGR